MTLDELYKKMKGYHYPILDRDDLMKGLDGIRVEFDKKFFDARDISLMIHDYPINKPSHLIELFISSAEEEYERINKKDFRKIED